MYLSVNNFNTHIRSVKAAVVNLRTPNKLSHMLFHQFTAMAFNNSRVSSMPSIGYIKSEFDRHK